MSKIKNILSDSLSFALLVLSLTALFSWFRTNHLWGNVYFEQILLNLGNGTIEPAKDIIRGYVLLCIIPAIVLSLLLATLINKNRYLILISVLSLSYCIYKIQLIPFLINQNTYSTLYEDEYANPENIDFYFPGKKRNIIVLYMESMETEYANPQLAGDNLLPNLSRLAKENISFDGYRQLQNQDYTIAGMITSFCSVPLRLTYNNNYTTYNNFMPGLICYPEILKENGYKTYFMKGATLDFTRTGMFFHDHGFDDVKGNAELNQAYGLSGPEYQGTSWGLNDRTLYSIAKERLREISRQTEPFLFALLTLDTHGPDVYLDKQCPARFNDNRDIVFCADKMMGDFIDWIKQQDFYQNTTIVILGDHTRTGKNDLYPQQKNRHIVNIIINPAENINFSASREWTSLDSAATILQAAGIGVPEGKFGLGRSLFSDTPTLRESMGNNLDIELMKSSALYDAFNTVEKTFEPLYNPYPEWGRVINRITDIQNYASFSDAAFNAVWLDTLSMTLPQDINKKVSFDIWFRILFMANKHRTVEVFANKQKIAEWTFEDTIVQPIYKSVDIPAGIIGNDRKLLLEFRSDGLGYTPVGIGIGVQKFMLLQD